MGKEKEDDREGNEKGTHVSMACQKPKGMGRVFFIILVLLCASDWQPCLCYLVESDFRQG